MTYREFKTRYNLELNSQQDSAVQAVDGPVLLLAVPGSGKTTVLVARLGYMIHCCRIPAENILTMTYTVAATQDMRRRFASIFGEQAGEKLEFRTINGLSAKIINYYERSMDRQAFQLVTDEGKLAALIGGIYRQQTSDYATESDIKNIRTAITYVKNMQLAAQEIGDLEIEGIDFAPLYHKYCGELRKLELMDYDDQMVYAYQILKRHPGILTHFQKKYRYLLVDEAQDTSKIQHQIIRLLAGKSGNLFMVGDEDQSIYGFRAAFPEALLEFEKVHSGARVLLMEKNYRSTEKIVAAADKFIRRNKSRHPKNMIAVRGEGAAISEIAVRDRASQYSYLANLARECRHETAVLYRDNDSALPVIDLLNRRGIDYRCRQMESGFFGQRIVRDIEDFIRFARRPADGEIFMRIYYKMGAGISKPEAERAVEQSLELRLPILGILLRTPRMPAWKWKHCKNLQANLPKLLTGQADRAVARILSDLGYGGYLKKLGADQNKVRILEMLGSREPTAERLLERLSELKEIVGAGSTDEDSPFILSTIHSSKGLEYERVLLMDVTDDIFPKGGAPHPLKAAPEELRAFEEERRLFYVGMTRAKDELAIFRFENPEHPSVFADSVLPARPAPIKHEHHKESLDYRELQNLEISPEIYLAFTPGTRLIHNRFGAGGVIKREDDIIKVHFDSGLIRRLSLKIALAKDLLRTVRNVPKSGEGR